MTTDKTPAQLSQEVYFPSNIPIPVDVIFSGKGKLIHHYTRIRALAWSHQFHRTSAMTTEAWLLWLNMKRAQFFNVRKEFRTLGWLEFRKTQPGFFLAEFPAEVIDNVAITLTEAGVIPAKKVHLIRQTADAAQNEIAFGNFKKSNFPDFFNPEATPDQGVTAPGKKKSNSPDFSGPLSKLVDLNLSTKNDSINLTDLQNLKTRDLNNSSDDFKAGVLKVIIQELLKRGVTNQLASAIVIQNPDIPFLLTWIDIFDLAKRIDKAQGAGYLVKAIVGKWDLPGWYVSKPERCPDCDMPKHRHAHTCGRKYERVPVIMDELRGDRDDESLHIHKHDLGNTGNEVWASLVEIAHLQMINPPASVHADVFTGEGEEFSIEITFSNEKELKTTESLLTKHLPEIREKADGVVFNLRFFTVSTETKANGQPSIDIVDAARVA